MTKTDTTNRLNNLRELMKKHQLQAYIVPSEDAHQSEYIAPCDARRSFISGFTGSAGFAVVTLKQAALWTDGRYFLQASKQLDHNWTLMKQGLPKVPTREEWLIQVLPPNSKVGIDPKLVTVSNAKNLKSFLNAKQHDLVSISDNLVDSIWTDKPSMPKNPIHTLPLKFAGKDYKEKINQLRQELEAKNVYGFVVTALDEICWLFNLRGSDIPFNPVFFAYALITAQEATLFVDETKLSNDAKEQLQSFVECKPYHAIFEHFNQLKAAKLDKKLWIDTRCNFALEEALGGSDAVVESRSPVMIQKAIKNSVELQGFRQCHLRDAAALCNYFGWLENELTVNKNLKISEVDGADKLEEFRKEQEHFVGLSFDTISSTGPNGAIIHYKPEPETCSMIRADQIYLCDSGAQYLDGTTDTTRTLHFGTPTAMEKEAFTRVLKGHIQIDLAVFPKGTTGFVLDTLARAALWRAGLDFRHGTGHGVGHYLNVHEGPQGIGQRPGFAEVGLEEGMTITDEPGFYQDGEFGIRIENILLIRQQKTKYQFGDLPYLGFEHVTMVPIQTKLVDKSLLIQEEVDWLNNYNRECLDKVGPLLKPGSLGLKWLQKESAPL